MEKLEDRLAMSADPLGGLLGGAVEHHAIQEEPPLLSHHQESSPDFWINSSNQEFLEEHLWEIDQSLANAHDQTGLSGVRTDFGFTGIGQTVAVIDSGIAYDHIGLGGGFGENYRVVGGWDFTGENDANPYDDGPSGSHGTHVSGIIGATGSTHTGVAPGVDLVGLRVFDDAGNGYFSWVEDALQWVHANRNNFDNPITAVNLSLGVASWNADSIPDWAMLEEEFAQLEADGIFIAVSAGNSYTSYNESGLSYPAASSYVVPVMSVDDGGGLSYFSQRHSRAIAAPGRTIVSTVPDYVGNNNGIADDYASYSGTSMASPYVAGASVIIREAMEFVGYTNITQDTIYDHMMATADSIFDSETNESYNRLNMSAAIAALMPSDDFGSSASAAFDLGTIVDTASVNGVIGMLSDADYFTFTAGSTGMVTFDVSNMTHELEAAWIGTGQASGSGNETYAFDVVGGQSYTVGFSSAGGLGYYDFDVTLDAQFSFTDWGSIAYSEQNDLSVAGEAWYRIEASSDGFTSVEGAFDAGGGQINLAMYTADMQMLDAGNAVNGTSRVDAYGTAGDEFFLRVMGVNNDVDFRLSNLVSISGTTVMVSGTDGDDLFSFSAGDNHVVTVNGVTHSFAANSITGVSFDGGAGVDTIEMVGTSGYETAHLHVGVATLSGAGYTVSAANVENVTINSGGGSNERAHLYDSASDDTLTIRPNQATLSGTGYSHSVLGFGRISAYSNAGGVDEAHFFDSQGVDKFIANAGANVSFMYGTGFYNVASGFDATYASSSGNRYDRAYFLDTAGADHYVANGAEDYASMKGAGYYHHAQGYNYTYGISTRGGADRATLHGSTGDDRLVATPGDFTLTGSDFSNRAIGFDRAVAYAGGGDDLAEFYDGAGADKFIANAAVNVSFMYSYLSDTSSSYYNVADGFDRANAYSRSGTSDRAFFFDSAGDDHFFASAASDDAFMQGPGYTNYAQGFSYNYGISRAGGNDTSYLEDSAGNDLYYVRAARDDAYMRGAGFYNYVKGFNRVEAHANHGGDDQLYLSDSASDDALEIRDLAIVMNSATGLHHGVYGFEGAELRSENGGSDTTDVDVTDYAFDLIGDWS
jgi:hypothetical protein